jgi:hypothetical protein
MFSDNYNVTVEIYTTVKMYSVLDILQKLGLY